MFNKIKTISKGLKPKAYKKILYLVLFLVVVICDASMLAGIIETIDKLESILINIMAVYGLAKAFKDKN